MKKHVRYTIYIISLSIFTLLLIYNIVNKSEWMLDNILSMTFLIFIFSINKWLKLGKTGLLLAFFALLLHNLGSFNFYSYSFWIFEYDTIVHFISSTSTAYIIFNFISRKLHIKENQRVAHTVVDEHKFIFIFLVIASVTVLGVFVELIEYGGYRILGPGDGMFYTGAGDSGKFGQAQGQYIDTMDDIITNIFGTITGVSIFYFFKYKKKPWLIS